jgi:UDP-N-acetylenolpyruvoylglucosamine reductase
MRWKGFRKGDAGCIKPGFGTCNYGMATGQDIVDLSGSIQQSVSKNLGNARTRK